MYKKIFLSLAFIFIISSCHSKQEKTSHQPEQKLNQKNIDPNQSKIEWKGFKILKMEEMSHLGTLDFTKGEIWTNSKNQIQKALFIVNMNSLTNTDLAQEMEKKSKLESDLKNSAFFDTKNFPTAELEITEVIPTKTGDYNSLIKGNLKIKNIAKPIEINANILMSENHISIRTEPTQISRKQFGLNFQSPIKEEIIRDEMEIQAVIKTQ